MEEETLDRIERALDEAGVPPAVKTEGRYLTCLVCWQPLFVGERKVHRGACARKRELSLQAMRRRLARR